MPTQPDSSVVFLRQGPGDQQERRLDGSAVLSARSLLAKCRDADDEVRHGIQCRRENRLAQAIEHYRRALALCPDHAEAHNNLGVVWEESGRSDLAAAAYQRAIESHPRFGLAWYNLGNCFREDNRLEEAIAFYRRAQAIMPGDVQTRINLAIALKDVRRINEALSILDQVLEASPGLPEARFNRALIHFLRGDLERGWDDYEGRLHFGSDVRPIPDRRWDGKPLASRSIVILSEQGIGDQVMFASCLPQLLDGAGSVFLECDARLVPLFSRSFPHVTAIARAEGTVALPSLGPCVFAEFVATLPRFLRRRLEDFPSNAGYLRPHPELVAKWRAAFERTGKALKVGISWRGGRDIETRRRRSIPLELWKPIFQTPGVQFVNIQYGPAAAEAGAMQRRFGIALDSGTDCDPLRDLDDFAAKIAALDLVLSVDNSTAHLAAALGRPVWTLLPWSPDWRWMLDRETTPWYRTMRLLRCPVADDWTELLSRAALYLASAAASRDFLAAAA